MNHHTSQNKDSRSLSLSTLVTDTLNGLSPIQTIMKIAEPAHIKDLGIDPTKLISFGGGWCNHPAPDHLRCIYQEIAADKKTFHESGRYSSIKGNKFCREQLARYERSIYSIRDITSEHIILGQSSTQLFHDLLRVLANPTDPICVLDPTYANYLNAIGCALPGSSIHFISALDEQQWSYLVDPENSLEQLKTYCSQGAKMLVVPIPDNPTSQIPSTSFLQAAQEILFDHQGFLILDHAYKALWFNDMPSCFSWSPDDYPNLISIHSNSKWLSSLGRRLGWIEAAAPIISGLEKTNESVLLSPDTMHSMATARFLETSLSDGSLKTFIHQIRSLYQQTAAVMMKLIDEHLGWTYLTPAGGLYTCCPIPNGEDPMQFIQRILKNTAVLLIPGIGFGPSMNHAVRLSYGPLCMDHDLIEEGITRLARYLS